MSDLRNQPIIIQLLDAWDENNTSYDEMMKLIKALRKLLPAELVRVMEYDALVNDHSVLQTAYTTQVKNVSRLKNKLLEYDTEANLDLDSVRLVKSRLTDHRNHTFDLTKDRWVTKRARRSK